MCFTSHHLHHQEPLLVFVLITSFSLSSQPQFCSISQGSQAPGQGLGPASGGWLKVEGTVALTQPLHLMQLGSGLDTDFDGAIPPSPPPPPYPFFKTPYQLTPYQLTPYQPIASTRPCNILCFQTIIFVFSIHPLNTFLNRSSRSLFPPSLPPRVMHTEYIGPTPTTHPLASVSSSPFGGVLGNKKPQVIYHPYPRGPAINPPSQLTHPSLSSHLDRVPAHPHALPAPVPVPVPATAPHIPTRLLHPPLRSLHKITVRRVSVWT